MANVEVIWLINFICARREMRCVCLHGVTGVSHLRFTYVGGGFTLSNFQGGGGSLSQFSLIIIIWQKQYLYLVPGGRRMDKLRAIIISLK